MRSPSLMKFNKNQVLEMEINGQNEEKRADCLNSCNVRINITAWSLMEQKFGPRLNCKRTHF